MKRGAGMNINGYIIYNIVKSRFHVKIIILYCGGVILDNLLAFMKMYGGVKDSRCNLNWRVWFFT